MLLAVCRDSAHLSPLYTGEPIGGPTGSLAFWQVQMGRSLTVLQGAKSDQKEKSLRVLVADDRPCSREALCALLATWEEIAVVGEAANGREALFLIPSCRPDVVLIDARMPVMNGLEATRVIKGGWPAIRVVMLTLYASAKDDALAAGADEFLIKGCSAHELLVAILN